MSGQCKKCGHDGCVCDTPTPRTDELYRDHMSDPYQDTGDLAAIMHIQCERFERELTAVTEQRDGLRSGIDYASDQLTRVTEQRDRLAEALNRISEYQGVDDEDPKTMAIEALQSLNQPTTP